MGITGTAAANHKKDRRKKPDELLSSVIRETAIPAAIELLRSNTAFVFPSGTAWVILVLAGHDIGGLSKRHSRDEAKGSIIELIDSDQITTVATAEMLAEDLFGIIPTEETLARMDEYSLLKKAVYHWAVVWQRPNGDLVVEPGSRATFTQAQKVLSGSLSLAEAVGAEAWAEHSGIAENEATTAIPAVRDDDASDEIFDPLPVTDVDEESVFDTEPIDHGTDDDPAPVTADVDEAPIAETDGLGETDGEDTGADGTEEPGQAHTPHAEVLLSDQHQAREIIARRFLSEELDLDIGLDEFTATFAIGAPRVHIEVPSSATDWLGDQVAQLNRQANAELAQLRSAHENELRALFVTLMSTHAEQVIRDVATDREGSRYKALKDSVEQTHRDRQAEKEQRIREAKARITQDFDEQATAVAQQAARQAELQYRERHRAKMQRSQADAVAEVERLLETAYTHDLREILRVRRSDAALKMQVGTTRIFELLAERQSDYLSTEEERLGQWQDRIQQVIDDNRKADIARADAMAEQHRTADTIEKLRQEQDTRLETQRRDYADRLRTMEGELERHRRDAVTNMQTRDAEWRHILGVEQERSKSFLARNVDLMHLAESAEDSANRRWMAHSETQTRRNRTLISLMVVLTLLVGVAGFISGALLSN
ncbi:hypothetical protein [Amycolatopsis sp. CA-230715]|uniref:hypothetical protein n=1 Tax=Amycolatopsis sp. CA-230715 TaxID=2745196 RepID=UPI001C018E91|nr:hypothetical protein [Amycolatopsis sp. CA-230715]QWF85668.1 hypothetical protein HUW46_09123 [Amycolatopsis sp. CA-230715]